MARFGRNPYPRRFGGGSRAYEAEHVALLDALAPGWDTDGAEHVAETLGHALAVSFVWALNGRLRNQAIPSRMLESLTTWEQACGLRPLTTDTVAARRRAVAAKLRGLVGNTLGDLWSACEALAGPNFVSITPVPGAGVLTYWPGVNPGPPGFEWASNRCVVLVTMTQATVDDVEFAALKHRLSLLLDQMAPAWLRWNIGVAGGFTVNVGVVGQTLL